MGCHIFWMVKRVPKKMSSAPRAWTQKFQSNKRGYTQCNFDSFNHWIQSSKNNTSKQEKHSWLDTFSLQKMCK